MASRFALLPIAALLGACSILPEGRETRAPQRSAAKVSVAPSLGDRQCLTSLAQTGSRFTALPDQYRAPGCTTLNTVSMNYVRGDATTFGIANLGPVTCPVATTFARWARYGVDRAARQILGNSLARIETMGSYACRNIAGSSRRSAHSTADAIDVTAFVLDDGRRIDVVNGWSGGTASEREFLRVVQRSACKRFGTVLGPDYNAAHRDHFHLERSSRKFCR